MKRSFLPIIIILSMLFSLSGSIFPAQASAPFPSLDWDQDGIANSLETAGWYNLTGGPYQTDPYLPDSDGDGLTDAEEKLFNTNPIDAHSPGIAVKYDNAFKTREYFSTTDPKYISMLQGGNQYLLTDALVVRRGTSFKIAALNSDAATLTISGSGMSSITPTRDRARGGWNVSISASGTVGTYTATITDGGWHKDFPIYVIFELPAGLTQAQIDAYVYDDDPANLRDEVAVWWRVGDYPYYYYDTDGDGTSEVTETPPLPSQCTSDSPSDCSLWQYHQNYGYAQAFWTEQFTKNVVITYTLPTIQGENSQYDAAELISHKADQSVRVNYPAQQNSFSSATKYYVDPVLGYHMTGGGCETNAGTFTSMLRSVGIASRPFAMDYNKTVCLPGDTACDDHSNDPTYTQHRELGNTGIYEYDHAVMMWVKGSGDTSNRWYADRTSTTSEDEYVTMYPPVWEGGTTGMTPLDEVGLYDPAHPSSGFGRFRDIFADLVQSVNEGWDFQNGSLAGGMVNTVWINGTVPPIEFNNPACTTNGVPDPFCNRDYKWDSYRPLKMVYQSPYIDILNCQLWEGDTWAPSEWYDPGDPDAHPPVAPDPRYASNPLGRIALSTYWLYDFTDPGVIPDPDNPLENWPYNPKPNQCSPSSLDDPACTAAFKNGTFVCAALPGQTLSDAQAQTFQSVQSLLPAVNSTVQFGKILSAAAVDENNDGRFDKLIVTVELTSSVTGQYQLGGSLLAGEKEIRADTSQVSLTSGTQTVQIAFDGQQIGDNQVDGPYQVENLWVAPASQPVDQMVIAEEMSAFQEYSFSTQAYSAHEFLVKSAYIADNFSYSITVQNDTGFVDAIRVSVPLNIAIPGTFTLQGDLYDGQGAFVGQAEWTGNASQALLDFQLTQTQPPYALQHLNLYDAMGKLLDARYAPAYTIENLSGRVDQGNITIDSTLTDNSLQAVTPPSSYTLTPVDSNGNGKYDQLVVSAKVDVTGVGGAYRIEGLLVDDRGMPAAWSVSDPQTLPVGPNQTLQLTFDARLLYELPFAGNQKFTLVAVKIFSGNLSSASLEVNAPVTGLSTPNYSRTQLEPTSLYTVFEDDMEGGAGKWTTAGSLGWSLVTSTWHSWSHAWAANGNTTKSGTLALTNPIDLTDYASPWLRFNTAFQLSGADSLKLQASTNGTTWTDLKTYLAGSTAYWSSEIVDLGAYAKTSGLRLRFNGQMNNGHNWLADLDDVFLFAGPAVKSASFIYSTPVRFLEDVTFTADYDSINKSAPVTYKWDFCGVTRQVTSAIIVYQFPSPGDCQVKLTVDNGYDSADATPQTVAVGKAAPTLAISPGPGGVPPVTLQASTTLVGGYNPVGSVTFELYPPADEDCSGSPSHSETVALSGSYASTVSGYLANIVGTWHWISSYPGDANNSAVASSCASGAVDVGKAYPTLRINPGPGGVPPVTLQASATLSQANNPTGSITFQLYPPADASCSGTPAHSETVALSGSSASTVNGFVADMVGTWHWISSYPGDANNHAAASDCASGAVSIGLINLFLPITTK
jgi:hypothetical protein